MILAGGLATGCVYLPELGFQDLGPGDVRGRYVDQEDGAAAAGAVVALESRGLRRLADGDGRAVLRNLPAGDHALQVTWDRNMDGTVDRARRVPIKVLERGGVRSALDLGTVTLLPTVPLSGTVRVAVDGACNPGLPAPPNTRVVLPAQGLDVAANGDAFLLAGVLSGTVELWAGAPGLLSPPVNATVEGAGVVLSQPLCMVDVSTQQASVTGSVVAAPGAPADALPGLVPIDFTSTLDGSKVRQDAPSAGFTLQGLTPGIFLLQVELPDVFLPLRIRPIVVPPEGVGLGELLAWPADAGEPPPPPPSSSSSSPSSSRGSSSSSVAVSSSASSTSSSSSAASSAGATSMASSAAGLSSSLVVASSSSAPQASSLSPSSQASASSSAAMSSSTPPSSSVESSSAASSAMSASASLAPSSSATPPSSSAMAPSSSGMVLPLLLTGATTLDTDGNGVLDTYRLVFSDPVEDSTFPGFRADAPGDETNAWMVAGRVGVHLLHGVAAPAGDMPGDNILHMGFSPRLPGADTAETPDVTTTASPGLQRADGMALSQVVAATVVETDGAAPALRGALVRGASELEVVFSEPPASAAATMVATYAAPGITLTSPVASGSSIRLTIGARTSGQILTVTSGAIQDAAGNALVAPRNTATLAFPAGNDGTLRARTDYASGTTAVSVAVADFNGNRIPDVVVANYNSNNLVVFLGNGTNGRGTGALTFGSTLLAGTDPSRVVVADFNANGILDIATANFTNDNVSVYLGNGSNGRGSGTFATQVTYSAGIGASSPTLGDFTGDGITDMVVANFGESFLTFLRGAGTNGRGNGTFTAGTNVGNGNTPYSSFAGDFNRDGILDLAVAFEGNDAVRVQLGAGTNGRGNGTFAAATSYPVGNKPRSVEGGDVNGDGIDDLVAVNFGDGTLSVLLGNGTNGVGNGTFQPAVSLAAQANPQRSQFVDFNHDQVLDLVNTNFGPDTLSVRLGNGSRGRGDGTFAAPVTYPAGSNPRGIIAADMDADGVMDLVVANELSNNISVFRGYGGSRRATLGFGAALTAPALDAPTWMVVADADRDGWEDVLVGDAAGQMRMIRSGESTPAGEGALYRAMEISGAATGVAAWTGDLNGDRLPDVVVAGGTANRLQVMLGQGTNTVLTGWAAPVSIPLPGEATDVVAADINSNKVLDLVVTSRSSNAVYILLGAGPAGRGDGTFGAPATLGTCTGPLHTRVADLSGDTIHELLVVCSAGVRLHRGQGTNGVAAGTFGAGTATALTDAADAVVMDANGDAIMDVVAASASVQRVWVMLGGGTGGAPTGALGAPTALGAGTAGGFTRMHVADLDADKLLDLALLDAAGTLTVFRAAGTNGVPTGSFASASTTALGTGTAHVQLTDVNHDGVVDLLAAGPGSAILRHGNWTAIP